MTRDTKLPSTLTLHPSRLKWAMLALIGAAFTAIALFVPAEGGNGWRWLVGGIFGPVTLLSLPMVFGIGSRLTLDQAGFTCVTLFRTWRRTWDDCSAFTPISMGPNRFVGFSTLTDERTSPTLSQLNRAVAGETGMLPDTYGMGAVRLADLMNRFRARALNLPG